MRRVRSNERGATLIEFALVITVVLTAIFASFETSRFMFAYVTLAQAARAGVRYAIVHGADRSGSGVDGRSSSSDTSQVRLVVTNLATAAGITLPTPTVTYSASPPAVGTLVTVAVSYTFTPITPLVSVLGVTLHSQSQGTICY